MFRTTATVMTQPLNASRYAYLCVRVFNNCKGGSAVELVQIAREGLDGPMKRMLRILGHASILL